MTVAANILLRLYNYYGFSILDRIVFAMQILLICFQNVQSYDALNKGVKNEKKILFLLGNCFYNNCLSILYSNCLCCICMQITLRLRNFNRGNIPHYNDTTRNILYSIMFILLREYRAKLLDQIYAYHKFAKRYSINIYSISKFESIVMSELNSQS